MSEAVFPTLAGQTWPRGKIVRTSTLVRRANGRRYALATQIYPTYVYKIPYSFLRPADLDTLAGFFRARRGRLDDFRFDDRDDNAVVDQAFGVGNGVQTQFQLVRALAGFVEPVYALNGVPVIKRAGLVQAPAVSATGLVTFGAAPAAGAALTWSGAYHWRVAFTTDEQEFEEFMRRLYSTKSVQFETSPP